MSGEVKVTKRKKLLNVLSPGEGFGEMAYLPKEGNEGSADASTMSGSRSITAPPDRRLGIRLRALPASLWRAFMANLVERLTLANTRLTAL